MYLIEKKVINKAIINGINFFPAAIGIKQINNITKLLMIRYPYIYFTHFILNTIRLRLYYQLAIYSSLTKKSVPIYTLYAYAYTTI